MRSIEMKKVLMVVYNYPPLAGMGMLRSLKFAKYLPDFGWKPTILTVSTSAVRHIHSQYWVCDESEGNLPGVDIIRTKFISINSLRSYFSSISLSSSRKISPVNLENSNTSALKKNIRKIISSIWNNWILFPDSVIGWYPFAVGRAIEYVKRHNVDMIFSTSLPGTSHIIANTVSKRTGIPWVADFRDPWSQAHYNKRSKPRGKIDRLIETRTLNRADALVTVSEPLRQQLVKIHRNLVDKSFVIYNGYDSDDYMRFNPEPNKYFNIIFTGRMYDIDFSETDRTPALLFKALAELFDGAEVDRNKVRFEIYGEYPPELKQMISKYQLQDVVRCLGSVAFRESFAVQQRATILLLLNWDDSAQKGILTGKVFEYLGARRPILAIPFYNKGVDDILQTTNAGTTITELGRLKKQIFEWYQEFISEGKVSYEGISTELEEFSRKKATEKLSQIFNKVSERIEQKKRTCSISSKLLEISL